MSQTTPTLMTPYEVAERFRVSTSRVQSWIERGELQAVLVSVSAKSKKPQYRIHPDAVEAFEQARLTQAPAPRRRRRKPDYERIV